jgi:hypothetical protein
MVTRALVQAELERLNADELSKVYRYIKQVAQDKPKTAKKKSLMASLPAPVPQVQVSAIEIDGPQDFAANHDLYVTG